MPGTNAVGIYDVGLSTQFAPSFCMTLRLAAERSRSARGVPELASTEGVGCTNSKASLTTRDRWGGPLRPWPSRSSPLVRRAFELLRVHRPSGLENDIEFIVLRHQLEV